LRSSSAHWRNWRRRRRRRRTRRRTTALTGVCSTMPNREITSRVPAAVLLAILF